MLILLYGQDTYRSRQKLDEIIGRYEKIHQSGLNLIWFKEILNFEKTKETIEAVSMFNEKKLIILENIFQNKYFPEEFFKYAKKNKLRDKKDIIVVIHEKNKLQASSFKLQASMSQEFKPLEGIRLVNWIEKETKKQGGEIDKSGAQKLAFYAGNDLWRISSEIFKLVSYQSQITIENIDLLVKPKIESDIFKTIDALGEKNKRAALAFLYKHLEKGESEIYLLTMLVYQFRNLIKLKSLIEQNIPYYFLAKETKLHPFVVKKTWDQLRNFSLNELKRIYYKLLETETNVKRGRFEAKTALSLFIAEL